MSIELLFYERTIAKILGLSREDLRYVRFELLKKNQGWRMDGRDVVYTQAGVDHLLHHLSASKNNLAATTDLSAAIVPASKKKTPPGPLPLRDPAPTPAPPTAARNGLVELTVLRCYPNPSMLRALDPEGAAVDVRVRTNKNFVPKMTLQGRLVCPGKYEMEGRCPRTRGRY
jgi:hypothetical protein